ncbi:lasso peptide biosynthesis B2 protein [Fodinicurvata sp. EGI_FJ10296]|uniref:lasso peptide biosynthesis B2 protein n=1 Tax=Fodinicurvata sp. EGI_FJ10296 TaxID=3231908 RepID=UPI003453D04E
MNRAASSWQQRILRFLRSPANERRLFLRAVPILAAVRIALWLVPLKTALRLTCRARDRRGLSRADGPGVHDLAQAVQRAGRVIPKANCLPQALASQIMLGRAGHESEVRIGIRQDPERGFEAHAWIEHRGEVVVGELPDMARFTPMPSLERYLGRHVPR